MKYVTYVPCPLLRPYIRHFAISESTTEKTYKVLPDVGLVMGLQYRGQLSLVNNQQLVPLHSAGITGLHNCFRLFRNAKHTGTVLVYFQAGGAASFFAAPMHELFGESLALDDLTLASERLLLEEQLGAALSDLAKISVVESFLISRLKQQLPDPLVTAALHLIRQSQGTIRIQDLAHQLGTSLSPLEKRFRQVAGTSPKKFASIIRFQSIIQSQTSPRSFTQLGYQAGFFDQAHFIKEFRRFTGQTPEIYFRAK